MSKSEEEPISVADFERAMLKLRTYVQNRVEEAAATLRQAQVPVATEMLRHLNDVMWCANNMLRVDLVRGSSNVQGRENPAN